MQALAALAALCISFGFIAFFWTLRIFFIGLMVYAVAWMVAAMVGIDLVPWLQGLSA